MCVPLTLSNLLVNTCSIQNFDKTGLCGCFLVGKRFFQLSTVQRLHLIGLRLQVHVDDVKCLGECYRAMHKQLELKLVESWGLRIDYMANNIAEGQPTVLSGNKYLPSL